MKYAHNYISKYVFYMHADLATGQSMQILIDRNPDSTTLHVNKVNKTIEVPLLLTERYSRKPWTNREKGEAVRLLRKRVQQTKNFLLFFEQSW